MVFVEPYKDLAGAVALVTGASSGIGAATAELLAECGADVAITWNANRDGADATLAAIQKTGRRGVSIQVDLRSPEAAYELVRRAAEELGPIQVLVNNAGSLVARKRAAELTPALWDEVMNLNLKSALLCTQAVMASMKERRRGSIINIASIAGRNGGGPGAVAYATAKGALITLTKGLAKELAPHGVRVNAVSPGVIDTPFHEVFSTPEMMQNFVKGIPLGRVGTSREVAHAIVFLASEASSYIVGETIEVNGGQLML